MVFSNNLLMGAAAASSGGVASWVPKGAIWLDGSADNLNWDPSGAGNRKTFTFSTWFKRCKLSSAQGIIGTAPDGNNFFDIRFDASDKLEVGQFSTASYDFRYVSSAVFRDPTAWMHLVVAIDTTAASGNRVNIYINGTAVTAFTTESEPSASLDTDFLDGNIIILGGRSDGGTLNLPFDGYLSESIVLDGYAALPSDFGTEDSNGVWIPKDPTTIVTDNKGTNGFWLDFANSSDLGNDVSGNNNDFDDATLSSANWTYDRPADSGTDTGNQCTFNPIFANNATNNAPTFSNGNLTATGVSGAKTAVTTIPIPTTGKWSCKTTKGALSGSYDWFNLMVSKASNFPQDSTNPQQGSDTLALVYSSAGGTVKIFEEGTEEVSITYWGTGTGNVEALVDRDANTIKWYMNGARIQDGGVDYTTSIPSDLQGEDCYFTFYVEQADISITMNYTASDTDYSVALGTQNLPAPTVTKPSDNFLPILYEGDGAVQRVGNFIPFTDSHTVNYSARFDSGDSDYLSRTPGTPSSVRIGTFSFWTKRGTLGAYETLLQQDWTASGNEAVLCRFNNDDTFLFRMEDNSGSYIIDRSTKRVFQDTGSWVHIHVTWDTNQTDNTACTVTINGVALAATDFNSPANPGSAQDSGFPNTGKVAAIGRHQAGANAYLDGYLSEVVFIDGSQQAASSFGQTDTSTNRWIPKDVSGLTFGDEGFYLNFADGNDLGDDESGEGNDWAESGLDTTNGSNQMYDTPTRNYNVMNGAFDQGGMSWLTPLARGLTEGNLTFVGQAAANDGGSSFMGVGSGKWYCEIIMDTVISSNSSMAFGIIDMNNSIAGLDYVGDDNSFGYRNYDSSGSTTSDTTGQKARRGTFTTAGTGYGAGDILGIAVDFDAGKIWMGKNNTWYNNADGSAGNPSAGTYPLMDGIAPSGTNPAAWAISLFFNAAHKATFNFGQWRYLNSVYGANVCSPGMTVTASPSGSTLSNLIDGNLTTNAQTADGSSSWYQIDLGVDNAKTVTKIWIDFKQDNDYISTWRIQASNNSDMSSSFDFFPDQSVSWSSGENVTFTKDNTTAYRYWRFEKTSGGSSNNINIYEIEMYESAGSTTLSTDAGGYFKYTPPTDFKAFQQDNLSENTAGITGFSWIKNLDATDNHILQDRVRGIYEYIISNDSDDEATNTNSVQRFLQQGVQIGNMNAVNTQGESYVLWNWVANGTSNPSVNTDAGFSIATYTGNGTGGRTVTHSLGVVPEFICVKKLGNGDDSTNRHWAVYHVSEGNTKYGLLSDDNAFGTSSGYWNNTTPGTSTFTVGTDDSVNGNNAPYVAYCWAGVDGYSKFGTYTGNGDADGPYIHFGFSPVFIMTKSTSTASWAIHTSNISGEYNPNYYELYANATDDKGSLGVRRDFLANGTKIRNGSSSAYNSAGQKYVYAAFAENPFGGSGVGQAKAR